MMFSAISRAIGLLSPDQRKRFILLCAATVVASLAEMLSLGMLFPLIKVVADPGVVKGVPGLGPLVALAGGDDHRLVLVFAGAFAAIFVVKSVYVYLVGLAQVRFIQSNHAAVARRLLGAYIDAPFSFHLGRNSADLVRNIHDGLYSVFAGMLTHAVRAFTEASTGLAMLVLLFVANPQVALLCFGSAGTVFVAGYLLVHGRFDKLGKQKYAQLANRLKLLNQCLGSIKEIKVIGRQDYFSAQYHAADHEINSVMYRMAALSDAPRYALEASMVVIISVVIMLKAGDSAADLVATLGVYAAAAFRLMPSANRLTIAMAQVRHNAAAVDQVARDFDEIAAELAKLPPRANATGPAEFTTLQLRGLGYHYPQGARPALTGIDLDIRRGEWVALVGRSGAGKSTLAEILLRLLEPSEGGLLVDGRPVGPDGSGWPQTGYVPQTIYIFDDTIRNNVTLGMPASDGAIERLLAEVKLTEFIADLPGGLESLAGERGVRMSGGQRQRLGIARALFPDPQLLVLDEATSALDSETERAFIDALEQMRGERTIIMIAHRLSTVRHCDRIVFVDGGRIDDHGSFAELMDRNPRFRALVRASGDEHEAEPAPL
ncbi:MAG: ABC transporter ATP-binding protein [Actinomycetota bacterium]